MDSFTSVKSLTAVINFASLPKFWCTSGSKELLISANQFASHYPQVWHKQTGLFKGVWCLLRLKDCFWMPLSVSVNGDMFGALSWTCLLCLVWSQGCRWCRWRLTSPDSRWRRSSVWRITGVSVWPGALREPRRAKRHMCASPVSFLSYNANMFWTNASL